MTLPDQLTAAEFERLKAQEQRMLNSGSWVPQAENVYAARLNESAARESMPDTMSAEQADVAAAQQSVMAEAPFGRSVGAEPDYSSTPAVNPADSEPKTIDELRRRQKEVYYDPTYDMPFDEWQEYTKWDRENSGAVEGFLEGLSGAPQALGQLGFNLAKERGQQYLRAMTGDPIGALDTEIATFKEMGRKVGVGLTQFVDWVGGKANDVVTSGRRVGQKQAQIVAALREDGKLTGDPMQDNDTIRMAMEEAAAQGMFDDSQNEQTEDEQTQYQRYLRQKQYDRDYAGISEYSLGGNRVTLPEVKQSFANPITGNVAQPQEATATAASMVFDPINAVPIGAGALSKVRMLRRLASVTGTPLKYAEQLGASADSWLMRQGDRITSKIPLVGDLPLGQRAAVLAGAAGVGAYVDSKTDGGLSLVTTPLMVAGGILPALKASGTVLRKTGAAGGAGWQIIKEMDAGGVGAARSATAERMASSGAFGQFSQYMRPGASGVESSLRRVSMNPDAPETLRRVARSADNIGITQVARAADDLVSSSLVAGATAVPFALVAPDEQTAGQIVGGAMTLGGALGTAGRFLGRRSARADADISRMLVDVEMAGGDAKSLLSLDYASLDWLAAQQGMTQGKVDVIPLRAQEYRANVDIKNSGAETVAGLHLDRTADGRAKIYVNMGHTAPIAGRVSVKDVQITRNGKPEKASVVRIKGEDGKSDFTVVPKEYPLLVKSGDVVGENTHLARGLSPRRIMPHEIGHAILTSNILDGAIRDDMRNLVNQQYGTDGIEARGREYVTRLVDRDIMAGAHDALPDKLTQQEFDDIAAGKATMADVVKGKPLNDAERARLINERMEEMRDQSRSAGNNPDGLDVFRDEVVAETFSSLSESIDFRNMRTGGPRVMESIYNGMTRMFETLGLNFDQSTGKLLDNPSVIFRDNPLTKDPVMRKRLQEHVRNYEALMVNMEQAGQRKQRGTAVSSDGTAESARRSTHTKLRPNDNGILENDIIFIDQNGNAQWKPQNMLDEQERGRASQVMFLYEKDKILPANSKEFGRRRAADGRILISGPTLPAKFDALRWFPRWLRPNKSTGDIGLARTLEASRDEGMSYIFDVNVIGSGESGRYRVKNRGDIRAVIREGAFIGWQATKNHHLNAVVLDLNAFRSSAMKAINDGKLGVFNNDMTQLQADLMQYMSNHKNGLPGEAGIGIEKRDLLNGLIGTGTAVQRAANPLYADLNPRGSIRTFRVDRLNDAQPTGRTGYHIDYDKINQNRMPSALPQAGMAMPDGPMAGSRGMPDVAVERLVDSPTETPLQDTYQVKANKPLYRTVSQRDWDRIEEQGFLDSDQRGAVSASEGANFATTPEASKTYAPKNDYGIVLEIDPDAANWHGYNYDQYIRTWDKIPVGKIRVVEKTPLPPEGADALRRRGQAMPDVADAPPFFLKSSQALDAKIQGKAATPDQVKAILTNPQNGIKAEELKWTGVMQEVERLAKENNGKVPKEALLRYLAEDGAVRLEEVRLGQDKSRINTDSPYAIPEVLRYAQENQGNAPEAMLLAIENDGDVYRALGRRTPELLEREDWAQVVVNDVFGGGDNVQLGRYAQYQLPGGENYREVVLAIPKREITQIPKGWRIQKLSGDRPNGYGYTLINETDNTGTVIYGADEATATQSAIKAISGKSEGPYTSSHFPDTPNYVAHMRLNERADAKGKPGLFIEELQNDRANSWVAARDKWVKQNHSTKKFAEINGAEQEKAREFARSQVSVGPFTENQGAWISQLFKRALRDAVADGKEWIGWTTGETQAARYDLSKQISKVLLVDTDGGNQFLYAYGLDGNEVIRRDVRGENIADIIGKEAAEKLANAPKKKQPNGASERALQGVDLKVGGEDKINTYDRVAVNEVAKYVKQWGAQVEKSRVSNGDPLYRDFDEFARELNNAPVAKQTKEQLAYARSEWESRSDTGAKSIPIWRVNITPQMREGIKRAGQALFVGGAAAVVAEDQLEQ